MHDGVKFVCCEYPLKISLIEQVAFLQRPPFDCIAVTGGQVVKRDGLVPGSRQRLAHMRADISGAAADKNGFGGHCGFDVRAMISGWGNDTR